MRTAARVRPPFALLLPFFALYLGFWFVPLLQGARLSVYSDTIFSRGAFVGAANYLSLLRDPRFGAALLNTSLYALGLIVTVVPLALGLALLLARVSGGERAFFQLLLLLPSLTAPAALAIVFLLVFTPEGGFLSRALAPLGVPPLEWLRDPQLIRVGLVVQGLWRWTGLVSFFLVGGLRAVPRAYYELAALEGARGAQAFTSITLPLLRPLLLFAALVLAFDAFALFDGAYVLFGGSGGPADAALLLSSYTYATAFSFGELSRAVAMSYLVAPLLGLFILLFARFKDPPLLKS